MRMKHYAKAKTDGMTDLKRARLAAGISQLELSIRTGLPSQRISFWERGCARPSQQSAIRLAKGLGMQVNDVFPDFASMNPVIFPPRGKPQEVEHANG